MLKAIIKKEVLETVPGYRFPPFAFIYLLPIPLGMSVNQANYAKRVRDDVDAPKLPKFPIVPASIAEAFKENVRESPLAPLLARRAVRFRLHQVRKYDVR